MKLKDLHDNRVELDKQIQPIPETNTETGWACLDRSRKRMKYSIPGSTMENSFITALDTAEGAEIFSVWERGDKEEWKVILKNLKDNWQQDTKFISAPKDVGIEIGNTITWKRTKTRWILVWQDFIYGDYFRGEMHRANYFIKWKNKHGEVKGQWAVVRGPVETKSKFEQTTGHAIIGKGNDTLDILIGANDVENIVDLERYKKIKVGKRTWRIQVVDNISSEHVIRLSCIEDYSNSDTDDIIESIPDGLIDFANNNTEKPEEPQESYVKIVGPQRIKTKLQNEFYAINEKEEIISGKFEILEGSAYIESVLNDRAVIVGGKKLGELVKIKFTDNRGSTNTITVKTVSMLS